MEIKYFHKVNCPYCESITNEISLIKSAIEAKKDIWTDFLFSANGVATDEIMKQEKESYNITSVPSMIVINNSGGIAKHVGPEAIRRVTPDLIKQIQESADVTITADKPTNSMAFIGVTLALLLLALLKTKK